MARKGRSTKKMASLAEELLQVLTRYPYEPLLRWIHTEHKYVKSEVSSLEKKYTGRYAIDTMRCINKHGRTITNGLFDIFGKFSKKSATETRQEMIKWIRDNMPEVKSYTSIAFRKAFMTVEDWLVTMTLNNVPGDELSIFCLSKMYLRHVIVYTKQFYWTTVAHDWADTEETVSRKCELELVYMGPGRFGEMIPVSNPTPAPPLQPGVRTSKRTKQRVNYASMNTGTEERKTEKKTPPRKRKHKSPLPKKEPSSKRIKAQKMLTRQGVKNLSSPGHDGKLVGTAIITSPSSSDSNAPNDGNRSTESTVKSEPNIKKEDDFLQLPPNMPRTVVDLKDPNVQVTIRHRDGSLCHSKKSYASYNQIPPPRPDELPDIPGAQNDDSVTTENSKTDLTKVNENELRDLLGIPVATTPTVLVDADNHDSNSLNQSSREEPSTGVNTENSAMLSLRKTTDDETGGINTERQDGITASINNKITQNGVSNLKDTTVNSPKNTQKDNSTNSDHEEYKHLLAEGPTTTQEKPSEKVYNEWITTFSDDSLFDEMTETMNINSTKDNRQKSPEQHAAESLILLSAHIAHEDSDNLLPVDTPKLPDLVKDIETSDVNTDIKLRENSTKGKTDVLHHETPNTPTIPVVHTENATRAIETPENNIKDKLPKSPNKGVFKMRTIGIRKHKSLVHRSTKKIGCSMCDQKFNDRQGLKMHHQQDHNILPCNSCGKNFSTKKSLAKHLYKHSELPWKCKECGEGYAFPSELKAHLIKHETEPMYKCNIIGCKKEYMRQSELTAHMKTHDGSAHRCPEDGCDYEAIDIRYLKNHMRIHSDVLPYPCKYCDEAFKHFMQRKRHYGKEHAKQ